MAVIYVTLQNTEQGHYFDVRNDISEKINICHMFSNKSLASVVSILGFICIADYQAHGTLIQML